MARTTAKTAVTSATRRLNRFSACSCSSSGLGSSTSAIGPGRSVAGAAPRDLVLHGRAPRLEGRGEPLCLLLEVLAALVEQVSRPVLGVSSTAVAAPAMAPRKNHPR